MLKFGPDFDGTYKISHDVKDFLYSKMKVIKSKHPNWDQDKGTIIIFYMCFDVVRKISFDYD
jgi:hypothetical protein